jgi:sugar phosphate isomerase/epimerase
MRAAVMDSVVGGRDDAEVFARAKRIGFSGVEVTLRRQDLRESHSRRLDALRGAREASGLEVPTLVLGDHIHDGGLADPSPDTAARARDDVSAAIAWANELGSDAILVPFFMRSELVSAADADRAVAAFRPLCAGAAERGVTLC